MVRGPNKYLQGLTNGTFLPDSQYFPPQSTNPHPDGDIDDADESSQLPPGSHFHVAGSKQDGCRTRAVVSHAAEQIAEESQDQSRQHRWRPHGDGNSQEGPVHGAHVSRVAGKEIVAVKIDQTQD